MRRVQKQSIISDLKKKIVFLVGPRQVGKTWLAKDIAKSYEKSVYLNYDRREDREIIKNEAWLDSTELLILDELHKMPEWKNYIKGVFDTKKERLKILVTGSARMDIFRQTGDALSGRFFVHRLLPFSLKEISETNEKAGINFFLERGGFPEPFLAKNSIDAQRWRRQYIDGLIRSDILDFEKVHDFRAIELVLEMLRERIGSPVSYTSIAKDVGVSVNTVKKYIQIFEALYIIFRVSPFSRNIARSILKEPKIYFFDTGLVKGDQGSKLENFVAVSLLKHIYGLQDQKAEDLKLHYLRNKEKKEVDFCVVRDDKLVQLIEVKTSDPNVAKGILYFHTKYQIAAIQLVMSLKRERKAGNIEVRRAEKYLESLYL